MPRPRNAMPNHSATVAPRSENVDRRAEIDGADPRTGGEQRNALACVIRRRRRRVVAVISRDEEQIVLAQGGENGWQSPVELAQRSIEPRSVVSVPEKLVEIY